MSASRIVVLGGGTGGTIVANRLRRQLAHDDAEIHVVDRDDRHVFQPGLLFVPPVRDIISVGEFYALAAGGEIIFT